MNLLDTTVSSALKVVLAVLVLVVAGCREGEDFPTTTGGPEQTSTTTSTTTLPPAATTTQPATEPNVQAAIDWFVSVLNGTELSEDEYASRFTEEFRQQVPYDDGFLGVLTQFRPRAPYEVVTRSGEGARGVAVVESVDGARSRIVADLDDRGRFAALTIQPTDTPKLDDPPETVAGAFDELAAIGTLRALTAEVVGDRCVRIEATNPEGPSPVGSVFKLYVLAALGEAVDAGEVAWDEEIVIQERLKSVPSGTLQNREAGETVTVRAAAELMISISDNTATDHLIDFLRRQRVETVMGKYGNTTPELNTPLLDTREFTALKIGPASGLRIQWLGGNEEERRAILDQISEITPADLPVRDWDDPIDPHLLEWFASPDDLCTLAVRLIELAESVPEIARILEINPGVPPEPGVWENVWFKGGSEPGLTATWFVTRSDGRTFVTAGSVVDPESVIDTERAILLFAAARDLLAP